MSSRRPLSAPIWLCAAALAFAAACPAAKAQGAPGDPSHQTVDAKPAAQSKSAPPKSASAGKGKSQKRQNASGDAGKNKAAGAKELQQQLQDTQADLQHKSDDLDRAQKELAENAADLAKTTQQLNAANNQLAKLAQVTQGAGPGYLAWLLPAGSALLSLFAIVWVVETRRRVNKRLKQEEDQVKIVTDRLARAESALTARQKAEEEANLKYLAATDTPTAPPPAQPAAAANPAAPPAADPNFGPVTIVPASGGPRKFSEEARAIAAMNPAPAPAAPADAIPTAADAPVNSGPSDSATAPPPEQPPAPPVAAGDIAADYNTALALGDDGPSWFKAAYQEWVGLSCTNLSELVLNRGAVPLFQPQDRGSFLGVHYRGEMRLVPAPGWNLEASARDMEGIFNLPSPPADRLRLARAALIEENGNLWQLKEKGEIRHG